VYAFTKKKSDGNGRNVKRKEKKGLLLMQKILG
jgi:hypothetical protein